LEITADDDDIFFILGNDSFKGKEADNYNVGSLKSDDNNPSKHK